MSKKPKTHNQLVLELQDLRARLDEAEETLRAIRSGEVDALVVSGAGGEQIFTLQGADHTYRALIEDMNDGALTLSSDGVILYCNRCFAEMLKAPPENVVASAIYTWIAPESQRILQALLRQDDTQARRRGEATLLASDGTLVPGYLAINDLQSEEMPGYFCMVATDLTEHKRGEAIVASEKLAQELLATANQSRLALLSVIEDQKQAEDALKGYSARLEADVTQRTQELRDAQEQLIRQEKLAVLGQLASSVAHELRNPLGVIANAVYFLKAVQPNADAVILDYLGLISAEVNNGDKIVTDLLDFARLKGVARETVDLAALVERALQKHPPAANISVAREGLDPLPSLIVDPRQVEQVITNLVVNACQAMPEGGRLTLRAEGVRDSLSASPEPPCVALQVADTGTGISPENMQMLFEPLFTTKAKGIGLGLAVSKKLIEANGGKIEVQSAPGQGSTFTIFLPVEDRSND